MADSDATPPKGRGEPGQAGTQTDPALFREINEATVFESALPPAGGQWVTAVADLIDGLLDPAAVQPLEVVLNHALRFTDADTAILSVPVDDARMEIRSVCGERADVLVGQTFDRKASIAGRVLDSGESAYVGMAQLKSPIGDIQAFGPIVIAPLRGPRAVGTLGLTKLHDRPPFSAADLATIAGFASLASIALHFDRIRSRREAASIKAERDRFAVELLGTVIRRLFELLLNLDSLTSGTDNPRQRAALRAFGGEIEELIHSIRTTIYEPRPHDPDGEDAPADHVGE